MPLVRSRCVCKLVHRLSVGVCADAHVCHDLSKERHLVYNGTNAAQFVGTAVDYAS